MSAAYAYAASVTAEGSFVRAMLATERQPSDPSWEKLLAEENVALVWPGRMEIRAP